MLPPGLRAHFDPALASHVPVDFFDPTGVHELQRTYTQQTHAHDAISINTTKLRPESLNHAGSDTASTIIGEDDFNFEKHLKDVIKR